MNQAPDDYFPSVVPELKTVGLTINFGRGDSVPVPGEFIVSVGRSRRVGTVYQVMERRSVKRKFYGARSFDNKWAFRCVKCPELKELVHVDFRFNVFIEGRTERIFSITWNPRNKKK